VARAVWTPIPIVPVDVETLDVLDVGDFAPGQRLWLEVSKRGQIIGIIEAFADSGGLSRSYVQELTSDLAKVDIPPYDSIMDELLPAASVVVPTVCRSSTQLDATIESLLALDYPDFEIIVVDNRPDSRKGRLTLSTTDRRVRVVEEPRRGVAAARNRGIADSTRDIIAFTDDDVAVDRQWLRSIGARFVRNPEVDGIGGLVLPIELKERSQLWFEEFFGGFTQLFSTEVMSMKLSAKNDGMFPYSPGKFGAGCNMAFRRSALDKNGGFDVLLGTGTPSRGGEDLAIFMKQVLTGGTLAFEPRAVVRHHHRNSDKAFFKQVFGYGTGLTAMFTALIIQDPRHFVRILRRIPGAYRILSKPRDERSPSSAASFPRRTHVLHLIGMIYGPFAYAGSVARGISQR
jgi:glycosyltransferase involved in cell wall biosynthesis